MALSITTLILRRAVLDRLAEEKTKRKTMQTVQNESSEVSQLRTKLAAMVRERDHYQGQAIAGLTRIDDLERQIAALARAARST